MNEETANIYSGLLKKIEETEQLIIECNNLADISGKPKLQRKIQAELSFLKRLSLNPGKLKEEHIRCSNIYHLSALVRCCIELRGVTKVLEIFSFLINDEVEEIPLLVDIVSDYGKTWVKVATRNPHHLYLASVGEGKYGRKSIVDQVKDMVDCAAQNPHMFVPPKIVVRLAAGVTPELKELLLEAGADVIGEVVKPNDSNRKTLQDLSNELQSNFKHMHLTNDLSHNISEHDIGSESSDYSNLFNMLTIPTGSTLNLDVSTFLAYVSNMTNGYCNARYNEKLLMDLAEMEREKPVKPILDQLFEGRTLVCCETAHRDFQEILTTVGGPAEKLRAVEFLKRVTIVPDQPSENAVDLEKTSKIKDRSKIVFGTGDTLMAVTVSANLGFLRAAHSQGIKFVAFVHESRALTECKELKN